MRSLVLFAAVTYAFGQPAIRSVFNGTDYFSPDGNRIARGAVFTVYGTGLGSPVPVSGSYPLRETLAGLSVQVQAGGAWLNAWPVYVSQDRVEAVLPSSTPTGAALVVVAANGRASAPFPLEVVERSFNGFLRFRDSEISGRFTKYGADGAESIASADMPARPGQLVSIWGSGLGAAEGDERAGPLPGDMPVDVSVRVADKPAPVVYRGRSGCCAGLDQIVIQVPADAPGGCTVPVSVSVAGARVHSTMALPVSHDGSPCETLAGVDGAAFAMARQTGSARVALVNLVRSEQWIYSSFQAPLMRNADLFSAEFFLWSAGDISDIIARGGPPVGGCLLRTINSGAFETAPPEIPIYPEAPQLPRSSLDAGRNLQVAGTAGTREAAREGGSYSVTLGGGPNPPNMTSLPAFFTWPDVLTVTGAGGRDAGPFTFTRTIAGPFQWINRDQMSTVQSGDALIFRWTNAAPDGHVHIWGESRNTRMGLYVRFGCVATPEAGEFTVPDWIRSAIPPTSVPRGMPISGVLGISSFGRSERLSIPGIDQGVSAWQHTASVPAEFR